MPVCCTAGLVGETLIINAVQLNCPQYPFIDERYKPYCNCLALVVFGLLFYMLRTLVFRFKTLKPPDWYGTGLRCYQQCTR